MNKVDKQVVPEDLSALADGEVDARSAAALSEAWRQDADLRARWHRYQLIGDVLRSPELAGTGRDASFLAALRSRLAQEPVVLAPAAAIPPAPDARDSPAAAVAGQATSGTGRVTGLLGVLGAFGGHRSRRPTAVLRRWAPPAALAAGFLVVAVGSLTLLQPPVPAGAGFATAEPSAVPVLAQAAPGTGVAGALRVDVRDGVQTAVAGLPERATGMMIRDARLDGYLAAHKQFGGSSALGLPSGFLRNATHEGASAPGER
jgi:sigma-E factor negative regulatory protein RseA